MRVASVDYLVRGLPLPPLDPRHGESAAAAWGAELAVDGIGRFDKHAVAPAADDWRLGSQDALVGLAAQRLPLALTVRGDGDRISVRIGTWSRSPRETAEMEQRTAVLETVLRSLYPEVTLRPEQPARPPAFECGGLALGVPSVRRPDAADPALPWDRVVRAMAGESWAVRVLALPLADEAVAGVRDAVVNEMRAARAAALGEADESPLARHYLALLERALTATADGATLGCWRVGAYLLGTPTSYPRLAAAWCGAHSGPQSVPEPVRVFPLAEAPDLAARWALPDQPGEPGPGLLHRLVEFQTLLSSAQLAAYVHLPHEESFGYAVDEVARFDTATRPATGDALELGRVVHRGAPSAAPYTVDPKALTRHVFVGGVTGSGKTNTILHLLGEADRRGVPWLVIEPAKTEYRDLLTDEAVGPRLRVYTLGDERVAPLRLNPFDVPPGIAVGVHLDLLRAVFTASFGMWTPLPQVLERCLYEIYRDQGWDFRTGTNPRAGADGAAPVPTLTDLVLKVEQVVPTLGYEERTTGEIRAALLTRLHSLRDGAKGRMFDAVESTPTAELLATPTVIELEGLGDDDDKCFAMALLLVRLVEQRRADGPHGTLRHLLVVEEAHRLLGAAHRGGGEGEGDPRGKVVDTFGHLLSEVRAYGQGIVVADQVPVRLAPDVLKNSNLKVAHRIVAADDRAALAAAMAMDERQARALTALGPGEAAVFGAGDDAPVLVQVPPAKPVRRVTAADVRAAMASRVARPRPAACAPECDDDPAACDAARALVTDAAVRMATQRLAASLVATRGSVPRLLAELAETVGARRRPAVDERRLLRAVATHAAWWLAARRGAQGEWPYDATRRYATALAAAVTEALDGVPGGPAAEAFADVAVELHRRGTQPYPHCAAICDAGPACLHRAAVADVVAAGADTAAWRAALGDDAALLAVARDAADQVVDWPPDEAPDDECAALAAAHRRAALCYAQQQLHRDPLELPRRRARQLDRLMALTD